MDIKQLRREVALRGWTVHEARRRLAELYWLNENENQEQAWILLRTLNTSAVECRERGGKEKLRELLQDEWNRGHVAQQPATASRCVVQ